MTAAMVKVGMAKRRLVHAPGLLNRFRFRTIERMPSSVRRVDADVTVSDREEIPVAGGIRVLHTPGHTEGHVCFLAFRHRSLFVGDAAANHGGVPGLMPAYENVRQGRHSLEALGRHDFDTACFGHGQPILSRAAKRFRERWGRRRPRP